MQTHGPGKIERLAEAIRAIETDPRLSASAPSESDGFVREGADIIALGCAGGYVHEWFGEGDDPWRPPLCVLSHLAGRAVAEKGGRVVWVGRACWPYPRVLVGEGLSAGDHGRGIDHGQDARATKATLLGRSIFVDPAGEGQRLWAVDLAARCEAVAAVVADGRGLDIAATRRLQLAAKAGGAAVLLARPARELAELSAAATRWRVRPIRAAGYPGNPGAGDQGRPRWEVQRLRCKGVRRRGGMEARAVCYVEWDHAKGLVVAPADLADRPGSSAAGQGPRRAGAG